MALIPNERIKLTGTFLNGLGIATVAAGVIAPLVALTYHLPGAAPGGLIVAAGAAWFVAGLGLHLLARWQLRSLRE